MKKKRIIISICILIALLFGAVGIYINDFYRAGDGALAAFASGEVLSDGVTVFRPEEPVAAEETAGLMFYPGGKVEASAYAPLLGELAEQGITCVLLEMPANLAVLDKNAAEGIAEQIPEVDRWYIGGHSLGGAMAASFVSEHAEEFAGLILLAAYSTEDLTNSEVEVLSIFGSEDGVLNRDAYEENRNHLPDGMTEVIIDGGNHAQFGEYGPQEGDGEAAISGEEQREVTVDTIIKFIRI